MISVNQPNFGKIVQINHRGNAPDPLGAMENLANQAGYNPDEYVVHAAGDRTITVEGSSPEATEAFYRVAQTDPWKYQPKVIDV